MIDETVKNAITRMAAVAYTPKQIAEAIGMPYDEFKAKLVDSDSEENKAFFIGLNSSELKIRESAFQLARNGSSPAQTLAMKLFDDVRKSLIKDGITSQEI